MWLLEILFSVLSLAINVKIVIRHFCQVVTVVVIALVETEQAAVSFPQTKEGEKGNNKHYKEALRKDKVIQLCDEMLFAGSHHMTHAFSPKKSPLKIQKKYNDGIS